MIENDSPAGAEAVAFVHEQWPADDRQLAAIRAEARRWLTSLGVDEDTALDMVLAVNEAATNAIRASESAADTIDLTFWTERNALCIEIVGRGRWRPPAPASLTGRWHGIPMMQQLVESVLIHFDARGTRVLLRHSLTDEPPALQSL